MTTESAEARWSVSFDTVTQMFCDALQAAPETLYCKGSAGELSYAQAAGAMQGLAQQLGTEVAGRTVALVLPNSTAFLIAYFGVLFAGARPALVNYGHPDGTIDKLLAGLDVATVLSDREIAGIQTTHFNDVAAHQLANAIDPDALQSVAKSDDIGAILFSGGTTGLPKQVAHSNTVLANKVERMEWGWPTNPNEIWLPVAPFTHVYGFLMGVLNPVLRAGSIIIPPRFQPDLIVDMLSKENVTIFGGGPPAIYQGIMSSGKFTDTAFPALRVCPGGGAPFPLAVHRRWEQATGLPITEGYGMTEIAPISVNTESDGMKPGAAGKPVPDTVIEIVDIQTGQQVMPDGESGEIRVKGPHMMTGYAGNPEETALTLRNGFVYTGDIGSIDTDGFLTISDRKKDVIFVKGFNVFPREIEEVLLNHPAVSGACVVGREDERAGELPLAFVTLKESTNAADILSFCRECLTDYKVPAEVLILESLPLTPAGKVDRLNLKNRQNAKH
ncbi:MAG: class I adenylate-forming enzyme family protein [Thiolinea sp.]